jgi:DNA-binding MarR family transcriptional regulator
VPSRPRSTSNLDTAGTRIGTLAERAGITRQAAGMIVIEVEQCGYVERRVDERDARATLVFFTPRGRELLSNVLELVDDIEGAFAQMLGVSGFERLRTGMFRIAESFDPEGGLGHGDL